MTACSALLRSSFLFLSVLALLATVTAQQTQALDFGIRYENDSPNLNAITATGDVEPGDADKLEVYLSGLEQRNHTAIYFSSRGGSLYEGMRIGLVLKQWGVKSVVEHDAMCASACALAFLGGRDRQGNKWMSSTTRSRLGFHAFAIPGKTEDNTNQTQRTVSDILDYATQVGAPQEIMVRTFRAASDSMDWFSIDDMLSLGIRVYDPDHQCFLPCGGSQPGVERPEQPTSPTVSPSFDCGKAASPQEVVICRHGNAARADRSLGEMWQAVRQKYRATDRNTWNRISNEQKLWIAQRDQACAIARSQLNKDDIVANVGDCIATYTNDRARQLSRY